MLPSLFYAIIAAALFSAALYGLLTQHHVLRKILFINIMSSSVFLLIITLSKPVPGNAPDPISQAMVITGIVVAVSATALALSLFIRMYENTGQIHLDQQNTSNNEHR